MKHASKPVLRAVAIILLSIFALQARAHCDTLSGPVVQDAKRALEKKDVTPVLKWVPKADEEQIRTAFTKALAVRDQGAEARDLADMYFFETLVRIHRAAEGAPYTGLKPATSVDPGIEIADQALKSGSVDSLLKTVIARVGDGIKKRYERVAMAKQHVDDSIDAGREFVEAYVDYVHFVENINSIAISKGHFDHHNEIAPSDDTQDH